MLKKNTSFLEVEISEVELCLIMDCESIPKNDLVKQKRVNGIKSLTPEIRKYIENRILKNIYKYRQIFSF